MKKQYAKLEEKVKQLFEQKKNKAVWYQSQWYFVDLVGKPKPQGKTKGECKTDLYIRLKNKRAVKEIKLSIKLQNSYEWYESKLTKERAAAIFGSQWSSVIQQATQSIQKRFEELPLLYCERKGNIKKGSVTMGWRLEITKKERYLSCPLQLDSGTILRSFYKGENLEEGKRHAYIKGEQVAQSGVADHIIYTSEEDLHCCEDVLEQMKRIDDLVPEPMYLTFIANNYRLEESKIDGSRPLAVYVDWTLKEEKWKASLVFDRPLQEKGKRLASDFQKTLFFQKSESADLSFWVYDKARVFKG